LSLGGTFGEATRLVQNNFYTSGAPFWSITYSPASSFVGGIHLSLHGDPTLRLSAVIPPMALTISTNGTRNPSLSWTASADAASGYLIYRSTSPNGPYNRLTPDLITHTSYLDSSVSGGTFSYQVKSAKLETTAGGTFVNTSQAISATIALGEDIPPALSASLTGGVVRLTWMLSAEDYRLQTASHINDDSGWMLVTGVPAIDGDRKVMMVTPDQANHFFRLFRP
jgi:hypothetical protein